jgi:hypothetical protein
MVTSPELEDEELLELEELLEDELLDDELVEDELVEDEDDPLDAVPDCAPPPQPVMMDTKTNNATANPQGFM